MKLTLPVKIDLGVIAMKRYSIFPKALASDPHYQMQCSVIYRTFIQRFNQTILQTNSAGLNYYVFY